MSCSVLRSLFSYVRSLYQPDKLTYIVAIFAYPHLLHGEHIIGHPLIAEYWYTKSEHAYSYKITSIRLCTVRKYPQYEFLLLEVFDRTQTSIVGYLDLEHLLRARHTEMKERG